MTTWGIRVYQTEQHEHGSWLTEVTVDGTIATTDDTTRAMTFPSIDEAWAFWRARCPREPRWRVRFKPLEDG